MTMASSDGVKEPHSFLSHSVGFPSAALIPVAKELLRNLMCMRSVRLLSPFPYHKEESALSLLSLYLSVGRVEADNRSNIKVRVQWYYRPEESMGGRRQFHGAKELFLSDHYDVQSAHTIEGKCTVHSFKNYTELENVGTEDYYCQFEYKAATGAFTPDRVVVYCKCEMPYNPDDLMVQCEGCKDWWRYIMLIQLMKLLMIYE